MTEEGVMEGAVERRSRDVTLDYFERMLLTEVAPWLRSKGMADWPIVIERDTARIIAAARVDGLGAAWDAAEAELPNPDSELMLNRSYDRDYGTRPTYVAHSNAALGYGPTPTAALQALTARLREAR